MRARGAANAVPYTFYLPAIDTQYEVDVVPGQITNVGNPRVPGLLMTIPAGANLRNRDGTPVTRVSITPVPIDRTPAPLPANVATGMVYTSQPGGALTDKPIPVVYPNLLGNDPGTQVQLYAFNHDTTQWYVYGTGRVSADAIPVAGPAAYYFMVEPPDATRDSPFQASLLEAARKDAALSGSLPALLGQEQVIGARLIGFSPVGIAAPGSAPGVAHPDSAVSAAPVSSSRRLMPRTPGSAGPPSGSRPWPPAPC